MKAKVNFNRSEGSGNNEFPIEERTEGNLFENNRGIMSTVEVG